MEDDVDKSVASTKPIQIKFISMKSPDYRLEFVNGAFSNITPHGEIVCNFHLEYRDIPIEQSASVSEDGTAKYSPFIEAPDFTRDVKFGVIMNIKIAEDIIQMLGDKIKEIKGISPVKTEEGAHQ